VVSHPLLHTPFPDSALSNFKTVVSSRGAKIQDIHRITSNPQDIRIRVLIVLRNSNYRHFFHYFYIFYIVSNSL